MISLEVVQDLLEVPGKHHSGIWLRTAQPHMAPHCVCPAALHELRIQAHKHRPALYCIYGQVVVFGFTGLTAEGPDDLARAANIWFRADLSRYLAHRPGVLTWNVMPGPLPRLRLGTLICHKPFTEFVLAFMYDPEQVSLDSLGDGELRDRISAFVGEDVDAEILGVAGWQVRAQIASAYSAGRVFCMGDAVHRHPPTNGLGLNMSIADAYNLGWKLALVLAGSAGAVLLESYSPERQPVGAQGVQRAMTGTSAHQPQRNL